MNGKDILFVATATVLVIGLIVVLKPSKPKPSSEYE